VLRLRGDIGIFDADHSWTPGRDILQQNIFLVSQQVVIDIITNLGGNQHGKFSIITKTQQIDNQKLQLLRDQADREYQNAFGAG